MAKPDAGPQERQAAQGTQKQGAQLRRSRQQPLRQFRVPEFAVRRNPRLDAGAAAAAVADFDRRHQSRCRLYRQPALRSGIWPTMSGAIVQLVKIEGGRVTVNLPASARSLLRADDIDTLYYQVVGPTSTADSGRQGNSAGRRCRQSRKRARCCSATAASMPKMCASPMPSCRSEAACRLPWCRWPKPCSKREALVCQHHFRRTAAAIRHHSAGGDSGLYGPDARHCAPAPAAGADPSPPPVGSLADTGNAAYRKRCVRWLSPSTR